MAAVLDMAYEIERYAIKHGRLPAAQSPAELSQVLLGTDSMTDLLVDARGTPLHIDADPEANQYMVASGGADRHFDREQWFTPAVTNRVAEDIIVRAGTMLRWPEPWALARFKAEGGDDTRALTAAMEASKANRTLADMMLIRVKLEEHVATHGALPETLAADLPRNDAWGTPFRVTFDRAAKTYRVVSAGADEKFNDNDAVLQNGELKAAWETTGPGRDLDAAYANFAVFKLKHPPLTSLSADERRTLRLEGHRDDMDNTAERQDYFAAMNFYEENEKLGVRDADRRRSWAHNYKLDNYTLDVSGPPGQPEPPRLMADARNREAAGRIAAALRRALAAASDTERWPLTEPLADLERERGESEVADQSMEAYARANPNDVSARLRQLGIALTNDDTPRVLRLAAEVLTLEPAHKETLYAVGVKLYEVVCKSGDAVPVERKRAFAAHARRVLARATTLDPEGMESLLYLSLVVRQQATLEPDAKKAAKMTGEADAIRARALDISKRRRAGQG